MISNIVKFFWKDLTDQEIRKYGLLSIAFFFTIGGYWLLRPLKDGVFFDFVGGIYQPTAKLMSVVVVSLLVMIYSKLVDMFEKHKLFYVLGSIYTILFTLIGIAVGLPKTGPNTVSPEFLKIVGWSTYFIIESFGSLIVALFWSFTASITDAATAKRVYPMVFAGAQIGAIAGPFMAWHAETLGMRFLFILGTSSVIILMLIIKYFMKVIPVKQLEINKAEIKSEKKPKTGFMEGLKLLLTRPYLFGIFAVVSIYEIVGTIVDFQMKMQAKALPQYATKEAFTSFLGIFGMAANTLAFFMVLLGTGYMMKKFGLRFCLLTFPITLGSAVAVLYGFYHWGNVSAVTMLWLTFTVMMIAKGLSYALNNPSKEMMYIPTSKDAKFKTKGWIDMFGSRSSKAAGAAFNNLLKSNYAMLMGYGTLLSLGFIGLWIVAAIFVSGKFNKLTAQGKIIE